MQLGALVPWWDTAEDPAALADFAQAAEQLGYAFLVVADNVLDTDLTHRPDWDGPPVMCPYHEPLVMFAYLASLTRQIEFVPEVVVLPQRQTALVAKQAAELDILCNGRLRLGVGAGFIAPLFDALNAEFPTRGARLDEQVAVLRALWTQELVTFHGRWHHIDEMRLWPRPRQRPIPLWFGGHAALVLRRVASLGDGWLPLDDPDEEARRSIERLHSYARAAGRDPATIGIQAHMNILTTSPDEWRHTVNAWRELGATHLSVGVAHRDPAADFLFGEGPLSARIDLLRRFKVVADEALRS